MAEGASAVAVSDTRFFASDIQAPPIPPDKLANAFQSTLLSFQVDERKRPITAAADKLNAMIRWAVETKDTQAPPAHESIEPRHIPRVRQEQAITRNFVLRTLEPLDALANLFTIGDERASQSIPERLYMAEMNQRFARGIYAASHSSAPKELKQNALLFIDFLNGLKHINAGLGDFGKKLLAGAVAQAQTMHIFDQPNHLVYLPDVNNVDELGLWELHGADMMVWHKGSKTLTKLDIKTLHGHEPPEVTVKETLATDASIHDTMLRSVNQLIDRDLTATGERFDRPRQIASVQLAIPVNLQANPLHKLNSHAVNDVLTRIDKL